jgi:uncharacterized protein YjbJ (UPF0337 family)
MADLQGSSSGVHLLTPTGLPRTGGRGVSAGDRRVGSARRTDTERKCVPMSGIDKMKNKAEELSGKGKESVGEATGDRDLQAEGQADQASGNLKQAGEKVKDVFK